MESKVAQALCTLPDTSSTTISSDSQESSLVTLRNEINLLAVEMYDNEEQIRKIKKKSARKTDIQDILQFNREVRKLRRKGESLKQEHEKKVDMMMVLRQTSLAQQMAPRPRNVLLPHEKYPQQQNQQSA